MPLGIIAAQTTEPAVAEGNAVLIAEQLVRILREGDNEAKFTASDVLWDLAALLVIATLCLLSETLVRFLCWLSLTTLEAFSVSRMIPILIVWLGDESEELRNNAAEALGRPRALW
ncbi:hypothetical protein Bca52824_026089 [Brassica carinata]|uniref:Uncharacterized protein n=1 Tax=Brassica carinata TaxID=52824 RepID=A0A8X7SH40_BRACI|nr:hypothetical protein Bca52824_026089 [Brassica carinata]